MPTKGKCWSCGEFAYLTGRLLQNLDDGHMEFHMICLKCAEYFAKKHSRTDPSLTLRMTEEVDRTDDVELGPWPSCGGAGAIPCVVREALAPAVRARYNAATKRGFYG